MSINRLIISDSEKSADLYYATRFLAPDPFIYARTNGRNVMVMSDLELDRAKSQAKVDEVISYSRLRDAAKRRGTAEPGIADVVDEFMKSCSVTSFEVPNTFSVIYADSLRKLGYTVEPKSDPFFPERMVKSEEEIKFITQSIQITEDAMAMAIELIHNSDVKPNNDLWIGGKPLTSQLLRKAMHLAMMEQDCVAQHTIVAGGIQAVDPHNEGLGTLKANEPIVIDVFPQHASSRYFADITRTVVKGKASEKVKLAFTAVKDAQDAAYGMIKDGVDGSVVHKAVSDSFESLGFKTGRHDGRMQGFFHGTGHGVGLEIHEPPRISAKSDILRSGMVVTVEPGLYYADWGGMRLEDVVVVTSNSCRVLTKIPKVLEV